MHNIRPNLAIGLGLLHTVDSPIAKSPTAPMGKMVAPGVRAAFEWQQDGADIRLADLLSDNAEVIAAPKGAEGSPAERDARELRETMPAVSRTPAPFSFTSALVPSSQPGVAPKPASTVLARRSAPTVMAPIASSARYQALLWD